jgi:UDP-GlcNAc3NAcA epimerase
MTMRFLSVVGARPQFVKAAVVAHAFERVQSVSHDLIHTGQHYDLVMSDIFFSELGVRQPKYRLEFGGLSHGAMTGRMLEGIEKILITDRPDAVIVYGDTNSTLAGALAAVKLHIPVAHVEAGLRSMNRAMPEEINRIVADHVCDVLFAPNETAHRQLLLEGMAESRIAVVGDVMFDAALRFAGEHAAGLTMLDSIGVGAQAYALATVHRAENTDHRERLAGILEGFARAGEAIVLPLHPRTRQKLADFGLTPPANVRVMEPTGFIQMLQLERNARCIVTDSGGVQKEAFFFRRPCVTLRNETEWTELVDSGWNRLVGCDPARIAEAIRTAGAPDNWPAFYGDGEASQKIVARLRGFCSARNAQ